MPSLASIVGDPESSGMKLTVQSSDIDPPESIDEEKRDGGKLTPKDYCQRVLAFARGSPLHSYYSGSHYVGLARILASSFKPYGNDEGSQAEGASSSFMVLCDLGKQGPDHALPLSNYSNFEKYDDDSRRAEPGGRLLFYRGYPSSRWLSKAGSKFDIDPEFFRRHLHFPQVVGSPSYYYLPSLPSAADVIQLRIITIGSWNDVGHANSLDQLRSECAASMKAYLDNLASGRNVPSCSSIVRRFSVHDQQLFTIEQMISIYVNYSHEGWVAHVWLDVGDDLSSTKSGPWYDAQRRNALSLNMQSIIQHRGKIALKHKLATESSTPENTLSDVQPNRVSGNQMSAGTDTKSREFFPRLPQTAAQLYLNCGRSLRSEVMRCDAFYSLHEIFKLAASSESQFLNMMKPRIRAASATNGTGSISDLQNAKDIIDDHRQFLCDNLDVVKKRGSQKWPKASGSLAKRAQTAAEKLEADFEYLLRRARRLSENCTEGITILMNDAMFHESQKAMQQTESIAKLTLLAFFFVPLSFTTSFFGMNFVQLNGKNLNIWIWFLVSVPVLALCFLFWVLDTRKVLRDSWTTTCYFLLRRPRPRQNRPEQC